MSILFHPLIRQSEIDFTQVHFQGNDPNGGNVEYCPRVHNAYFRTMFIAIVENVIIILCYS